MQRRDQDPSYSLHEPTRADRDREGPRTDAAGQEDQGAVDALGEQNQRLNKREAAPEEVRESHREHGSPGGT